MWLWFYGVPSENTKSQHQQVIYICESLYTESDIQSTNYHVIHWSPFLADKAAGPSGWPLTCIYVRVLSPSLSAPVPPSRCGTQTLGSLCLYTVKCNLINCWFFRSFQVSTSLTLEQPRPVRNLSPIRLICHRCCKVGTQAYDFFEERIRWKFRCIEIWSKKI